VKGLVYLATPYSKYPRCLKWAYIDAAILTGRLLQSGVRAYSPIVHTHPIAVYAEIDPYDHDIWLPFDEAMMEKSDHLLIALMDGWNESKGIKHEIEFFRECGKPISTLNPITLDMNYFHS